jgi:hypothetical protein
MIIPVGCVFRTKDGRIWFAVECFTENLGYNASSDKGPKMTWRLYDDQSKCVGNGYLYKTAFDKAGIAAAKRCAKRLVSCNCKEV